MALREKITAVADKLKGINRIIIVRSAAALAAGIAILVLVSSLSSGEYANLKNENYREAPVPDESVLRIIQASPRGICPLMI